MINIAANMFLTTSYFGLHIRGPTARTLINVTANQFRYFTSDDYMRAITIEREGGSGTDASGVVIFGNQIYGPATAIKLENYITGPQIVENTFVNTTTPIFLRYRGQRHCQAKPWLRYRVPRRRSLNHRRRYDRSRVRRSTDRRHSLGFCRR